MAENIHVKLPDGSVQRRAARDLRPRHRQGHQPAPGRRRAGRPDQAAVAERQRRQRTSSPAPKQPAAPAEPAKNNAQLVDLTRPLEQDAELRILTDRDPEALEVYRHSSAHLMAAAVLELFPETKLGHGPATESGFFYDFYREKPFTPEDLEAIEKKMQELVKQDLPYAREFLPRQEGLERFKSEGDFMKCHFIEQFTAPDEKISIYKTGKFTDFCRGPHIPSTGRIKAFKLLNIAGAYWLGDEKNPQLQRIYGTSFFSKKDLDEYLHKIEEAKKRDHRVLGKQLDLFSIQELAGPGLIFWHPKGGLIRKEMEDWMRNEYLKRGYSLVYTPHVARVDLWKTSGHEGYYAAQHVHPDGTGRCRLSHEADELSVPHPHLQRLAEVVSRSAGAAGRAGHGLSLRALGRDARPAARARLHPGRRAHLLHPGADRGRDQSAAWTSRSPRCTPTASSSIRWSFRPGTRTTARPSSAATSSGSWRKRSLKNVLERRGIPYKLIPGEAAFYGPKIDIKLVDAIGRLWQLSTVQFDFNLPERFGLEYVGEDGRRHQPLMVHRALYGSEERFFGVLLEHYAGAFPVWLSPVQVVVIPIGEKHHAYANEVGDKLKAAGVRVHVDLRNEKMNAKIREHAMQKVPFQLVVGDKEMEAGEVNVRVRGQDKAEGSVKAEAFVERVKGLIESKRATL